MMLRIDNRKDSKFTCKLSTLMEIPRLISLLKLHNSIQLVILIPKIIPFLESILIPFPEQIAISRSISDSGADYDSRTELVSESAPELMPSTELESSRSDSERPPLIPTM